MTEAELNKLFELAVKLYKSEEKKSGMLMIPYAYARKNGSFLIISPWGKPSDIIEKKIKKINFDTDLT